MCSSDLYDLSNTDAEHEKAINIIKTIAAKLEIPVIGAGNVHKMEDIKKLLYAGCHKAALNYSKESNIALTKEVSSKFGKDKIIACINTTQDYLTNHTILKELVSELVILNHQTVKEVLADTNIPIIAMIEELSLEKLIELLAQNPIHGISGTIMNHNYKEIAALKTICSERNIPVNSYENVMPWENFKLNSDGMLPVVVQDYKTNEVLMVAYMNKEAYVTTLRTGKMTYYSRSRNELWIKGATSGHYQFVKALSSDCDNDTLLAKVSQIGAACHTGNYSCFFHEIVKKDCDNTNPLTVFEEVFSVIKDRKINPKEGSYTNYLFDKGVDKILKKLGEEATEIVIAAKNPNPDEIKYEISDFLYHMMVLMAEKDVTWEEITNELANR